MIRSPSFKVSDTPQFRMLGFGMLAVQDALVENTVFPAPDPRNPHRGKLPLYVRVAWLDEVLRFSTGLVGAPCHGLVADSGGANAMGPWH